MTTAVNPQRNIETLDEDAVRKCITGPGKSLVAYTSSDSYLWQIARPSFSSPEVLAEAERLNVNLGQVDIYSISPLLIAQERISATPWFIAYQDGKRLGVSVDILPSQCYIDLLKRHFQESVK